MKTRKLKILRGLGTALYRVPTLAVSAVRHVVAPSGFRYVGSVSESGFKEAHWAALGQGMVRFFQESGPVLTKLGQILSTRTDILPEKVCRELEALYNRQPPMRPAELEQLLRAAYGKTSPFAKFEEKPMAVGSVGQVHRARLHSGERVIVKVVRPGSSRKIKRDIYMLMALGGGLLSAMGKPQRAIREMFQRVLEDLEISFLSELNLRGEGQALERFRKRMRRNSRVYIPEVYRKLSSTQVLVVEELKGESLNHFRERHKGNRKISKEMAETALREILTQIFEHGNFHADPHAGNFLVLEDGRLALIDFGLTGEFTNQDRKKIGKAVKAMVARDADAVIKSLLEFGTAPSDFELGPFKKDIASVVQKRKAAIDGANLDQFVNDLFTVTYRHHIYIPPSTTLLIKTLVTIEGVARSLDPEIKLVSVALPVILRSMTPKWLRFFSS